MNLLLCQSFKQHNNTLTKFEGKPTLQAKKLCQSAYAHEQNFDKVSESPLCQSFKQHNNTLTKFEGKSTLQPKKTLSKCQYEEILKVMG